MSHQEHDTLVGTVSRHEETFNHVDVRQFAALSGDFNPIHLEESEAEKSMFGECICHGMLVKSTISAALEGLPGTVILLSDQSAYRIPVPVGSTVEAVVTVEEDLGEGRHMVDTLVTCDGEDVITGSATVLITGEVDA